MSPQERHNVKLIVGVSDSKISASAQDVLVTHALGSCLGIAASDLVAGVGGLLHVMLASSSVNPDKARANPFMFVDTGLPAFFHALYTAGACKANIVVRVAGGANIHGVEQDTFAVGKRNMIMLRKILWKNGILIDAEDVGGSEPRTMYLEVGGGRVLISKRGQMSELIGRQVSCR